MREKKEEEEENSRRNIQKKNRANLLKKIVKNVSFLLKK